MRRGSDEKRGRVLLKLFILLNNFIQLRLSLSSSGIISDQFRCRHKNGFFIVYNFIVITFPNENNGSLYTSAKMCKGALRQAHNRQQLEPL